MTLKTFCVGRSLGESQFLKILFGTVIAVGVGAVAVLAVEVTLLSRIPDAQAVVADDRRPGGSLVICGGGRMPEEVRDRFIELAGGRKARIVVIPTAHAGADGPTTETYLEPWRSRSLASLQLLHTRSRAKADETDFVKPLTEATGVWFGGGKQSYLTDAYVGTAVERQLKAVLERGGVIGGSSAGAAVMTRVMIAGGRSQVTEGRGFDFLPGSVVDQHFLKRNRVGRLLDVLSRHPGLLGFGIDEQTALVVRGRSLDVIGNSYVMACLPASSDHPARLEFLKRGDHADLATLMNGTAFTISPAIDYDNVLTSKTDQ
jgi:cyanophycinase